MEKRYIYLGTTAFLVFLACLGVYYLIFHLQNIISLFTGVISISIPIVYGMLIAYFITPLLNYLEERVVLPIWKRAKLPVNIKSKGKIRTASILLTLGALTLFVYILLSLIIPQISESVRYIGGRLNYYQNTLVLYITQFLKDRPALQMQADQLLENATTQLEELYQKYFSLQTLTDITQWTYFQSMAKSVANFIANIWHLIIGFIISIYMLAGKENFAAQAKKLVYACFDEKTANAIIRDARSTHKTFSGFIIGKLVDSFIIGIICFFALTLMHMPFTVLISVIIGITNVIPFFGPFLGAVPSVVLVFVEDPTQCLAFLVFVIVLQQFDGNILGPKILGDSTGLPGFWVIFAITFFGAIWGIAGMFFGVPIFAVFYKAIRRMASRLLTQKRLPENTEPYRGVKAIEDGKLLPLEKGEATLINLLLIESEKNASSADEKKENKSDESPVLAMIDRFKQFMQNGIGEDEKAEDGEDKKEG